MRYWPLPSLTTVRTLSISAALMASTVTSGSAAPDASCTVPAIACANAVPGTNATSAKRITNVRGARTIIPRRVKLQSRTTLRPTRRSRSTPTFHRLGSCESPARVRWHRDVGDDEVRVQYVGGPARRVAISNGSDQLERLGLIAPPFRDPTHLGAKRLGTFV